MRLPDYSASLVDFITALDAAEMTVRSVNWHFGDLEFTYPEMLKDPSDTPSWSRQHLEALENALPTLRAQARTMIALENPGVTIEPNGVGDADTPEFVDQAFAPILSKRIHGGVPFDITYPALAELPPKLREVVGTNRAIYFDGETFIIPDHFPPSFIEVWFRRACGYWEDGGAYPMRLEKRAYGWQAFGIER